MRLSALVALAVTATMPTVASTQSTPIPPAIDNGDLVALLADFNAEHGAGPLDGCALQEGGRLDVAALVARRPELAARIDVVESPCSVERHDPRVSNRGFLEAVRLRADHLEIVFQTVISDGYTRWTLRLVRTTSGTEIASVENSGTMYAHGGQNAPPPFDLASTAGALGLSSTVRFRIEGSMLREWPATDSITIHDFREALPEPGFGVQEAVGEHGFFLNRLACYGEALLAPVPLIARVAAVSEAECEPRDDHRTDILLSGSRPSPPNQWQHKAFGITNALVWAVEVIRAMDGTVIGTRLIGAIRLPDTGALAGG